MRLDNELLYRSLGSRWGSDNGLLISLTWRYSSSEMTRSDDQKPECLHTSGQSCSISLFLFNFRIF